MFLNLKDRGERLEALFSLFLGVRPFIKLYCQAVIKCAEMVTWLKIEILWTHFSLAPQLQFQLLWLYSLLVHQSFNFYGNFALKD